MNKQDQKLFGVLGAQIRMRREDLGVSQERLAKWIRRSRTSVVNIEAGRQCPPIKLLIKIADHLNCRASEILREAE